MKVIRPKPKRTQKYLDKKEMEYCPLHWFNIQVRSQALNKNSFNTQFMMNRTMLLLNFPFQVNLYVSKEAKVKCTMCSVSLKRACNQYQNREVKNIHLQPFLHGTWSKERKMKGGVCKFTT